MSDALNEQYLTWLYSQVADINPRPRARTFQHLFRQLFETIFVSIVDYDENRIEDAKELRYEFLANREDLQGDPSWTRADVCNMLEILIILSRQLAFEMDEELHPWFWHLVETLELEQYNDRNYDDHAKEAIDDALTRVIFRTYKANGEGGLFPLRNPVKDQREVELWYQLNAYLLEQF